MKTKSRTLLKLEGTESQYSYGEWKQYPVKLCITEDDMMQYISYHRLYPYEKKHNQVFGYGHLIQFSKVKFYRYQVEHGYQIDIDIETARFNNPLVLIISIVPEKDNRISVYIYENNPNASRTVFEIDTKEYMKIEKFIKRA